MDLNLIVDAHADKQHIQVIRTEDCYYSVLNNGDIITPSCDAESVMQILESYLNNLGLKLNKLVEPHPDEY